MSSAKFNQAKTLIKQKRYAEARAILQTINHPMALDLIAQADAQEAAAIAYQQKRARSFSPIRTIASGLGLLLVIAFCSTLISVSNLSQSIVVRPTYTAVQSTTPGPSPTATRTPTVTSTPPATSTPEPTQIPPSPMPASVDFADYQSLLTRELDRVQVASILRVDITDGRAKGGDRILFIAYGTAKKTQQGYNDDWIAILSAVGKIVQSNNLDLDGVALVSGTENYDTATGILVVYVKDIRLFLDQKITRVELLNRAKFGALGPTPIPATPRSFNAPDANCPANCPSAVAMGLTELEAGRCTNLDRDRDGLACYGN